MRSQVIRRDSTLTSCVDKLDRSRHPSGPLSASFARDVASGASSPENVSSQDSSHWDPAQSQLGTSPAQRGERVISSPRGSGQGTTDVAGSPSAAVSRQTTLVKRRDSSLSQSPDCSSPLTVSIPRASTQENLQRVIKEDTYISENKTMQLLLSPTGSGQTSPQDQRDGRELSPHRTLSDWIKGNVRFLEQLCK